MYDIEERLISEGMSPQESVSKSRLFHACRDGLESLGADLFGEPIRLYVPGRIEVLGKHTDYAGGRSLLCTLERGICLMAVERFDATLRLLDARSGSRITFNIEPEMAASPGLWGEYPITIARRLAKNFPGEWRGADIVFASDLPPAAGLSSSSALIVAVFAAISAINHLEERQEYRDHLSTREDLAGYLGACESGRSYGAFGGDPGVGTLGGSQDHTAILCCRPATVSRYAFCPVRLEAAIPMSQDHIFVIAVSGVAARKTGDARERYNRASRAVSRIVGLWCQETGRSDATLADALASAEDAPQRIRQLICESDDSEFKPQVLLDRLEQFVTESWELVPATAEALAGNDWETVGRCVDRSQAAAEKLLGNQIFETRCLVRSARELGSIAASAFGAGFGGSVWALLRKEQAADFRHRWQQEYKKRCPELAGRAQFFATQAGPAMVRL